MTDARQKGGGPAPGHSGATIHHVDEGFLREFLADRGVELDALSPAKLDRVARLVGEALAALDEEEQQDASGGDRSAGQKTDSEMTENDTDDLKNKLIRETERAIAEATDEQQRDDLGNLTVPVHERQDSLVDDYGRRNRRRGMTPKKRERKLEDALDGVDAEEPRSAIAEDDGEDDPGSGDAAPEIEEVADGEGW